MNIRSKHAQICRVAFIPIAASTVINLPGATHIQVSGTWIELPNCSAEFSETNEPGKLIEQQFKGKVTDMELTKLTDIYNRLLWADILLRLTYTNGDVKVVGTDQFPVRMTVAIDGEPAGINLSFKRTSPEKAKFL